MRPEALTLDADGPLAETEGALRVAFAEAGLDWTCDRPLCERRPGVTGGRERVRHVASEIAETLDEERIRAIDAAENTGRGVRTVRGAGLTCIATPGLCPAGDDVSGAVVLDTLDGRKPGDGAGAAARHGHPGDT